MPLAILTDESIIRRDECLNYHDPYDNDSFSPRPPLSEIKSGRSNEQVNLRVTPPKKYRNRGDSTPPRTPGRDRKASFSSFTLPSRSSRSHSASSVSSGILLEVPPMQSGCLQKNCRIITSLWVTRYFVVANGTLSCFSSESDFKDKKIVKSSFNKKYNLRHFNLVVDRKKNLLLLESMNKHMLEDMNTNIDVSSYKKVSVKEKVFRLYVKDEDDLRNWEKAFQRHILYSRNCQDVKSKLSSLLSSLAVDHKEYESHKNTIPSQPTDSARSSYHGTERSSYYDTTSSSSISYF